ncbi:MAG: hypothetical protein CMO10_06290 [Thalassospira sp.]|nr:hypothetical protein [Thalassospira sp.]|tara:strand:- start:582 stop:2099 length:1518 start_codon:yes stop_codon:yes gene_type:complete
MSLRLTDNDIRQRCQTLAHQIADDLAKRQRENGQFEQPDFYAKAFGVNLWSRIDPNRFARNIERALVSLKSDPKDKTYHREFIEYALLHTPGLKTEITREILRGTKQQCPDVANWQMLGLINRQKRQTGFVSKLINRAHLALILLRYWRAQVFLDRPKCFSPQYHAFCTALLSDSENPRHRRIADHATATLAHLTGTHGYANLLGRGAGQSFGAACALYMLLKNGYLDAADAILHRMEDACREADQLPLNLLAPALLPEHPGPDNPDTPGWYSYNRHDDYLAFAGYWLLKAAQVPAGDNRQHPELAIRRSSIVAQFSCPNYHAQMTLCGKQGFDVSGAPVIVSVQGKSARILLPPTGGEQDVPSLYNNASTPLPAMGESSFSRFLLGRRIQVNRVEVTFDLTGIIGHRQIEFQDKRVIITDHFPDYEPGQVDLFRILIDGTIELEQTSPDTAICPQLGIKITADTPLQITSKAAFSAVGIATRISAKTKHGTSATLTISWGEIYA